jgi:hypothetical protein
LVKSAALLVGYHFQPPQDQAAVAEGCDYLVVPALRGVQQIRTHKRLTEREQVEITGGIEVTHEEVRTARHSDRSACFGL